MEWNLDFAFGKGSKIRCQKHRQQKEKQEKKWLIKTSVNQKHYQENGRLCNGETWAEAMAQLGKCPPCRHQDLSLDTQNLCESQVHGTPAIPELGRQRRADPRSSMPSHSSQIRELHIQWEALLQIIRWWRGQQYHSEGKGAHCTSLMTQVRSPEPTQR